jgi:hypothetical protein
MGTETAPSGMMGRFKKDGNHSPPENKLVQDSEGNEENRYQFQTPTKQR